MQRTPGIMSWLLDAGRMDCNQKFFHRHGHFPAVMAPRYTFGVINIRWDRLRKHSTLSHQAKLCWTVTLGPQQRGRQMSVCASFRVRSSDVRARTDRTHPAVRSGFSARAARLKSKMFVVHGLLLGWLRQGARGASDIS